MVSAVLAAEGSVAYTVGAALGVLIFPVRGLLARAGQAAGGREASSPQRGGPSISASPPQRALLSRPSAMADLNGSDMASDHR
ncbi:hypothetical protein [Mycolicibacterium palauense]|uniref:hypothetical protein n=1 Tax=Mycolicibacterium palauense TaxID=2034511 RepID=UPI00114604B2|nr:hypothetical protein [Mycolicibacterium palauense]